MRKSKDVFRADNSGKFEPDLPPCPNCGKKMYVEKGYRVAHFCKGPFSAHVKTDYYDTPEEAVAAYKNGNIKIVK